MSFRRTFCVVTQLLKRVIQFEDIIQIILEEKYVLKKTQGSEIRTHHNA